MPRKPKQEKQTIQVVIDGVPVAVVLHPPTGNRTSWFAYWTGLVSSKSTGHQNLADAIVAAEHMVRGWKSGGDGTRPILPDTVLTDDGFEAIQRTHFDKKTDPIDQARSHKSLVTCLEAIRAFKDISALERIALATADDCAAFQRRALMLPKNWRQQHPRGKKPDEAAPVSPNTVLKWSRALQAAFERANRHAGKKCVRGVVPEAKLLISNPWNQFDWIEGRDKPIRQFDAKEIISLLDYVESRWAGVTVAPLMAKVFLWSACRQQEVAGLKWSSLRRAGEEVHFEVVGKWGVERWFRIPFSLYRELEVIRTESSFVFAAYTGQLRRFHERNSRSDNARRVRKEFKPMCLGDWFADRVDDWSASLPNGHAHTHVLRKTTLQYARAGEDVNRQVATDARVGESVMMTSYVKETDEQQRQASNRTFARILASLPANLAQRCGYVEQPSGSLEESLRKAIERKDWPLAAELTARLAHPKLPQTG
jgi:integrase